MLQNKVMIHLYVYTIINAIIFSAGNGKNRHFWWRITPSVRTDERRFTFCRPHNSSCGSRTYKYIPGRSWLGRRRRLAPSRVQVLSLVHAEDVAAGRYRLLYWFSSLTLLFRSGFIPFQEIGFWYHFCLRKFLKTRITVR